MQPDLELKPTASGRVVLVLLGVLFLLPGIVLLATTRVREALPAIVVLCLVGLGLVVLAVRLGARRLILDAEGVEVRGLFSSKRMAWADIQSYSFASIDSSSAIGYQGGLVGVLAVAAVKALRKQPANRRFASGRLVLFGTQGNKLVVQAWFKDIDQGLERIFATIHPRLAATTGNQHGKLSFDGNVLGHTSKGVLPLHELDKVTVSPNGVVTIRKVGKRLAWASVGMASVTSSLLLFERLTQRGVVVEVNQAVFLPLPTLGMLNHFTQARQNLPQARINQR
ncbi:MAG TPA: PH domain-containing protein [Kofleriaceae bacterium]